MVDWEGIVIQDVLDGGNFCVVIIFFLGYRCVVCCKGSALWRICVG